MRFTAKIFHRHIYQYPDKAPASVSQPPATTVYSPHFLFKFHRPVIELVMIDIIHICLNSLSIIALSVEHFPWKVRPYTLCYFAMFNQCYFPFPCPVTGTITLLSTNSFISSDALVDFNPVISSTIVLPKYSFFPHFENSSNA